MIFFKSRNILALDFCCTKIKAVEGRCLNNNLFINRRFIINLPKGVYKDGIIYDFQHIAYVLTNSLKQYNKLSKDTRIVINSTHIITRNVIMPNVSHKKIRAILKYKIEDYIPVTYEDYIIEFIVNDSIVENKVEKLELLLIAIPREMVRQHFKLAQRVNLSPKILDFQGNAISKVVNYNERINKIININGKTIASIELDYNFIKINIVKGENIKLSKVLEVEFNDIVDSLNSNNELKINISNLLNSINIIFSYYYNQNIENLIDVILLQGNFIQIQDIEDYFNEYFNILTIKLEKFDRIESDNIHNYSTAIGALIRRKEV